MIQVFVGECDDELEGVVSVPHRGLVRDSIELEVAPVVVGYGPEERLVRL